MNQNARAAERVADAAAAVEERTQIGSRGYAYAAGVEDALRWMLGQCSPNVFSGADEEPALRTLTEAAKQQETA